MHRILLIEDSPDIQIIVKTILAKDFLVTIVSTVSKAWKQLEQLTFDLILLDLILPDEDGFKFCAMLKATYPIPIIILSGKTEVSDKVMGLSLGASDYIAKPFSPLELRARIQAHLRDQQSHQQNEDFLRRNDLCFNIPLQKVSVITDGNETELNLTPIEYRLLLHLVRHQDQIFTRNQILDAIWGDHTYVVDRTVDVHISNLRKKLAISQSTISAVQGIGYQFIKKT